MERSRRPATSTRPARCPGNPLATAAGLATLRLLDAEAYADSSGCRGALARACARRPRGGRAGPGECTTGLLTVFFSDEPVRDYEDALACDLATYAAFCRAMLERGIYLPPSQFEAWFPSLAHTDLHVERTLDARARVEAAAE